MKLLGKFTCYFPKKPINILHNHSPQTIPPNIFSESMGFSALKRSSMKGQKQPIFIPLFLIFSVLFLCFSASVASNEEEVENEREFDYSETSEKGPHHWGDLKKEWAACKTGAMQSPIDLTNDRAKIITTSVKLGKNYKPAESIIKNRGHDISVTNSTIQHTHTHTHTINYIYHCFHVSRNGQILVLVPTIFVLRI
ncbi:hypothetical protein Goklo_027352 [Gossypium klotzschianum]|uniref:Alpha-carbonic anhydrase domain-containing protein n=1 Tax=Gossypium klotzschianum TaxID=34286 RepID=A0A7J8TY25_9ROSI|nr:hypothetical protein [Gossypium klotzschianum]